MQDTLRFVSIENQESILLKYILPSVITLFIGIVSFTISQIYFKRQERTRLKERYIGYLRVIGDEVKRNLDLMSQLHAYIYVGILPSFRLSDFVNSDVFGQLTTVCLNHDLLNGIFYQYFEYRHIQARIDRILNWKIELDEIQAHSPKDFDRERYVEKSIREEAEGTLKLIEQNIINSYNIFNRISTEIKTLDHKIKITELHVEYLKKQYENYQTDKVVLDAAQKKSGMIPIFGLENRPKYYEMPICEKENEEA
jgi:hypothetical protein